MLACVVFGFTLDKNSISPPNMKFLHRFFHMMGHLANTEMLGMSEDMRKRTKFVNFFFMLPKNCPGIECWAIFSKK